MSMYDEINRPWLDSYDAQVDPRLDYESMPLFAFLDRSAAEHPDRPAVAFKNLKMSYAKLKNQAETLAAALRAHGLRPGDRVAIMLPNLPQCIVSYWAVLKAGATVVMTNPLYMEKELLHQINDAGCRFIITLDLLYERVNDLWDRLPLERIVCTRIPHGLAFPLDWLARVKMWREGKRPSVPFDGKRVLHYKSLLSGSETFSYAHVRPETDLAVLQYTGGTTGVPKGCMLTHANLVANVSQCCEILHSVGSTHERFLSVLPYFHVYGLTVCLNLGTAVAGTQLPIPRFVPAELLEAIDKQKPTIFPGAPSIYIALMHQKTTTDTDFSSLRYCVSGSAPMPVEIMERFHQITGAEVIEGYGLTEASPVTHLNPIAGKRKAGTIGLPFPDTDAAVVDMETGGPPLPPGKQGELILRGPQVMQGYWNRPDETASTIRNGWLFTGDVAVMDEEGYFSIVDRKKDMIISAGYNIYPREIDEVLYEHPKVAEAVVVGIPSKTRGEEVKAYIVPRPGEEPTRAEIIAFCKEKLAAYKVPRKVEIREELPKTLVGKVLRRALREEEERKRSSSKAASES
jgi:long-chain acyl-CoA synthetase